MLHMDGLDWISLFNGHAVESLCRWLTPRTYLKQNLILPVTTCSHSMSVVNSEGLKVLVNFLCSSEIVFAILITAQKPGWSQWHFFTIHFAGTEILLLSCHLEKAQSKSLRTTDERLVWFHRNPESSRSKHERFFKRENKRATDERHLGRNPESSRSKRKRENQRENERDDRGEEKRWSEHCLHVVFSCLASGLDDEQRIARTIGQNLQTGAAAWHHSNLRRAKN